MVPVEFQLDIKQKMTIDVMNVNINIMNVNIMSGELIGIQLCIH
jgi:hypothetical protein